MSSAFTEQNIVPPMIGGLLIAIAIALQLYLRGKLTSISSIFIGFTNLETGVLYWKFTFCFGLIFASTVMYSVYGTGSFMGAPMFESTMGAGLDVYGFIIGGYLIGVGSYLTTGCISTHAFCGIPRFNPRAMAAVPIMLICAFGMATLRHVVPFLDGESQVILESTKLSAFVGLLISVAGLLFVIYKMRIFAGGVRDVILSFILGFLYGMGVVIAGLARRASVVNFFTVSRFWTPGYMFALATVMLVGMLAFYYIINVKKTPKYAVRLDIPQNRFVGKKLKTGAMFFGVGLGLTGLSPDAALLLTPIYPPMTIIYLLAISFGMVQGEVISNKMFISQKQGLEESLRG